MKRRPANDGFTLLELLVAASITVVLAGLMLAVTGGTLDLWHRAQDSFTTDVQAKFVLDHLERDLQTAIFRDDGNAWLAADIIDSPAALTTHGWLLGGRMKPATTDSRRAATDAIGEARFGLSGVWLRWVMTNLESGGSLPATVAYQIARRPVSGAISAANPAAVRYSLFRSVVTPESTFAIGYDLRSGYQSNSAAPGATRSPPTITNPNTSDVIATNVVDFGCWFYVRETSGKLRRIFPADEADGAHMAVVRDDFPVVVDVAVRILTEAGARAIEGIESVDGTILRPARFASDAEWWWATVEANSRVYVRRVEVLAAAP